MEKLKYTAFLLTVVMLLNISVFALDYANDNAAETINVAEAPAALAYPELLSEDRLEKKHTERLYEKEADLMYPASPAITDSTGLAIVTGLDSSTTYGVNVIAQNYAAKSFDHYISPGQQINEISLSSRTLFLNPPLSGFTALSKWPHNNTSNCTSMCSTFTRICPHQYMNVYVP